MSWSGLNRRTFPRVIYPCLVRFASKEGGSAEILLAHTENIGEGGLCVIVKKAVRLFTPVDLEVDLLDVDEHLKVKGKVVWSVRRKDIDSVKPLFYDIGVEFVDLSDADKNRLKQTTERLIKNGAKILKTIY